MTIKLGDSPLAEQEKDFSHGRFKISLEERNRAFHREQLQAGGDCRSVFSGFSLYVCIQRQIRNYTDADNHVSLLHDSGSSMTVIFIVYFMFGILMSSGLLPISKSLLQCFLRF